MILFNGHIYNMHRKKLTFIFGVKKKHVKVFLARSLEFMIENLVNHVHDGYLDSNEAVYLARCTKTWCMEFRERPREVINAEVNLNTASIA